MVKRTSDETLVAAMRVLARDIQCEDGVANAAISEAADRIESLVVEVKAMNEYYDNAMRDDCGIGGAEKHCTCVPLLKREIDRLRALLKRHNVPDGK